MNLIIFPGVGNPDNKLYKEVYSLLENEAVRYGYKNIDRNLKYPGHVDEHETTLGNLTLYGAMEESIPKIKEYEAQNISYDFLGRSFGTIVAVKTAVTIKPKNLRRIILWGPPPYWLIWQMFLMDLNENRKFAANKGAHVDETFFQSITPLESMLALLEYPTVIATGTKDPYSKPAFINYLKSLVGEKCNFSFRIVEKAPHEVTPGNCSEAVIKSYSEVLFREHHQDEK